MPQPMSWLQVLALCRSWLAKMVADEDPKPHELSLIMAKASLGYAHDTLDAVATELLAGRPLQAAVLVRTMFELAMRVRWASLFDDGWNRLVAYWVRQHEWCLNEVGKWCLDAATRERVEQSHEIYKTFLKDVACPQRREFDQVLAQVVEREDGSPNREWSGKLYTAYRDLCRYAHANMTACAGGIPLPEVGRVLLVSIAHSTVQFVKASCATFGATLSKEQLDELYGLVGCAFDSTWDSEG